ncbi:MAG: hypothetical protein GX640_03375, partial [Fibrobacter sp.]|nr:hypothetical protein [Fibrobacter sp.]
MQLANAFAEIPLQWKVFTSNNMTWMVSSSGVFSFSALSRSIKTVTIDEARNVDTISDGVEYEGYLYLSTNAGIYQLDMNSQSCERIPLLNDTIIIGKIGSNMDYIWLATSNTLYRFDKLGREWINYKLPETNKVIMGIFSNDDEVFCSTDGAVYKFTISTEKWNTYTHQYTFSSEAAFFKTSSDFFIAGGKTILKYHSASVSWSKSEFDSRLCDLINEDSILFCATASNIYKLSLGTGIIQPIDIPGIKEVKTLSKNGDTLFIAEKNRIFKYNLKNSSLETIEYPQNVDVLNLLKITTYDEFIIAIYNSMVASYDKSNRIWSQALRAQLKQPVKRVLWNEDGFKIRYGSGTYQTSVSGNVQSISSLKLLKYSEKIENGKIDSVPVMEMKIPNIAADVNVHTYDKKDQFADIYFNNSNLNFAPSKYIYFRGNRDDRLNTFKIGTNSSEQIQSPTMPVNKFEGVNAVVESKAKLSDRDRKIIHASAGSGYLTTKTVWKMLPFRTDGIYYLNDRKVSSTDVFGLDSTDTTEVLNTVLKDTSRIVPGSMQVWVDGELLDQQYYTFFQPISKLQFKSNAPIDPVSSITIQYKVQTIPDKVTDIEFVPEHNFGLLHYGNVTLSPKEWLSARVGFVGFGGDSLYPNVKLRTISPVVNIDLPIEIRKTDPNFMIKLTPDFNYNMKTGARAGSTTLQSRFGDKTGFTFNGLFADSNYHATDTISRGYGAIKHEYDFNLSHDIMQELPVSYYQHQRVATEGKESKFAFSAGTHFTGFPFLDIGLSRMVFDREIAYKDTTTALDSIFHKKDKFKVRLYEMSSNLLQNITHFDRISYDISHFEYRTDMDNGSGWNYGRMSTFNLVLTPRNPVNITADLIYRGGMHIDGLPSSEIFPSMKVQTIDAPKGVDLNGSYSVKFSRYAQTNVSSDTIKRSFGFTLKPGQWLPALQWLTPRLQLNQTIGCNFNTINPGYRNLILGPEDSSFSIISGTFGVNIFPSDMILLTNISDFSKTDSLKNFTTTSDLQLWFNSRNYLKGTWIFSTNKNRNENSGQLS